MKCPGLDERAFTLLEILMVLLIVGFLTAASLHRFDVVMKRHNRMVVFAAVAELNCREKLIWANEKLASRGFRNDPTIFSKLDPDLGKDYSWKTQSPAINGGLLVFQEKLEFTLKRMPSNETSPGKWTSDGR